MTGYMFRNAEYRRQLRMSLSAEGMLIALEDWIHVACARVPHLVR